MFIIVNPWDPQSAWNATQQLFVTGQGNGTTYSSYEEAQLEARLVGGEVMELNSL